MLEISQRQIEALQASSKNDLLGRIDDWLRKVAPRWTTIERAQNQHELRAMAERGTLCGMKNENELAVFVWTCVALGPDWEAQITEPETWKILSDPAWNPEVKLMHLDETRNLGRAAR